MQAAAGSFDYVRLAPHFAQDDSGVADENRQPSSFEGLDVETLQPLKLCNLETLKL
jgi:hypothetical protein